MILCLLYCVLGQPFGKGCCGIYSWMKSSIIVRSWMSSSVMSRSSSVQTTIGQSARTDLHWCFRATSVCTILYCSGLQGDGLQTATCQQRYAAEEVAEFLAL